MKYLTHRITLLFAGVLAAMIAMWGYSALHNRGNKTPFQHKADAAHDSTQAAVQLVARVDTVRLPALVSYRTIRDRTPNTSETVPLKAAADRAISLDSSAIAARDSAFARQGRELQVWQNKPGPPRLQAFAEGLYDVVHSVPVARVGATFRVTGPISISGAGQYAAPSVGKADPGFRATVGLRYDF